METGKAGGLVWGVSPTLTAEIGGHGNNFVNIMTENDKPILYGSLEKYGFSQADNVFSVGGVSPTIMAHLQGQNGHQIQIEENEMDQCKQTGAFDCKGMNEMTSRVYSSDGLSPSVRTYCGGNQETKIESPEVIGGFGKKCNNGTQFHEQNRIYDASKTATAIPAESSFHPCYGDKESKLRIRKLTPSECMRLMGFEKKDTEACKKAGLLDSNIYHQSGDSIVSTVMVALFSQMLGKDYKSIIAEYSDRLAKE